ncbi:MAG: deoxyguanosinetriphosphate triphosphohydrolase [Pseudomonadota bacterium]
MNGDFMGAGFSDYGADLAAGERRLAPYAASAIASRGRRFEEPECPTRSAFQRDRDRILHAAAFRRLTYKTQVFVYHEGDHFRSRLTHSLEVAQIARTITRQLCLDEDLAETLALAHDLGHSPFGHAGEHALNEMTQDVGGFDHNAQSLRVVTALERRHPDFDGLNLTFESLEGLAKHNGPVGDAGNPVAKALAQLSDWRDFELAMQASAEAQIAALSDDIAYVSHDIDDALRAGLLDFQRLSEAPLPDAVGSIVQAAGRSSSAVADHGEARQIYQVTRLLITLLISDVVAEGRRRMAQNGVRTSEDIRAAHEAVIAFSEPMRATVLELKAFLFENVYRHPAIVRTMEQAQGIVRDLFAHYLRDPSSMQVDWAQASFGLEPRAKARLVSDFVAGMTDRFAVREHRRLFDVTPELI